MSERTDAEKSYSALLLGPMPRTEREYRQAIVMAVLIGRQLERDFDSVEATVPRQVESPSMHIRGSMGNPIDLPATLLSSDTLDSNEGATTPRARGLETPDPHASDRQPPSGLVFVRDE